MLNHIQKNVFALAVLAATATPALAAGIDLKVIGTITPAACTPTLSGGGTIDYGIIPAASLAQDEFTVLEEKSTDLSITCSAPTKIALLAINGRKGTLAGTAESISGIGQSPVDLLTSVPLEGAVGLGADGGVNVGGYALRWSRPSTMIDGTSGSLGDATTPDATVWTMSTTGLAYIYGGNTYLTPIRSSTDNQPTAFTTLSIKLLAKAYINKASELDLSKPIQLDGLTTLEMIYL